MVSSKIGSLANESSSQQKDVNYVDFLSRLAGEGFSKHTDFYCVDFWPGYVKDLIAGGATGAISKTAVAPLERIKILLQTRTEGFHSIGVYQSLKKVINHEGFRGLYKGNSATVIRVFPYSAFRYITYEQYRSWILNNCLSLGTGPFVDLLAGSAAGGTAVLCTYPLDLARTKLAYDVMNHGQNYGIQGVFKNVYKESGFRGFYRGIGPTLVGILPYTGLKFYVYEKLKREILDEHQSSFLLCLSCGAIAGLCGSTFTYPLDVIRKQMQVENLKSGDARYKTSMEELIAIIRTQGWKQMYAGLSINYIKVIPSTAIGFTAYDLMKSWLHVPAQ